MENRNFGYSHFAIKLKGEIELSNYDFHKLLEPLEFERLVCDIVQQRDGIFLKMYKEGRDLGIDGLFTNGNEKTIVQVKRYQSDFKRLIRDLEQIELPKVRKLNPDRYILGLSMVLNPEEEIKIIQLFEGYILNHHDVINGTDINRILEQDSYKRTLLKYHKLWMPNINVLEKVIIESAHRAIYQESIEELKAAIRTSKSFVPTRIYTEALQKWTQDQVVVLSGEPGVGKTTTAYMLALAFLQPDNLNGFVWANSIQDVYAMLEDEKQQVIILDDFWGSIFLGNQTRKSDEERLKKLIDMVLSHKGNKRLILTTREYILQQGLQKHPVLKKTLDKFALIFTVEEYSDEEKASILFSHLYASPLEYEYVNYLFMNTDEIVNHDNYNPRVLALFLNNSLTDGLSPEDYYNELCDYFDNPIEFWKDVFLDLSSEAQIVSLILLISSTPMQLKDMKLCYEKYIYVYSNQLKTKTLGECIAELEKTMLKTFYDEEYEDILLKFSMPAVQDFLYSHLKENCELIVPQLIGYCAFYNQLQFLLEHVSNMCSEMVADLIAQNCIKHYFEYGRSMLEFDGSWNWDFDSYEETRGQLDRFYHLLQCCKKRKNQTLYLFLESEIHKYCSTMGNEDLIAKHTDLQNLPDIVVQCANIGMSFSEDIIYRYFKNSFSVNHYLAMQKFQDLFPDEYAAFHNSYYDKIVSTIEEIIISELIFLQEYDLDMELDILIDSIPEILKQFGKSYTKEFNQKIIELCGREPYKEQKKEYINKLTGNSSSLHSLKHIKESAANWLFGPQETYLEDDQIIELITNSDHTQEVKNKLIETLNTSTPRYIYDYLQRKESINLLLTVLHDVSPNMPINESNWIVSLLLHISKGDQATLQQIINFCAESLPMFMYLEEPIIRLKQFIESDEYNIHLKNNSQMRQIVFEYLILQDEQWVRFIQLPIFFFCYTVVMCYGSEDEELESYYPEIWGDNFHKFKKVFKNNPRKEVQIFYADFGPYYFKNHEWERYMYTMFEELRPYHFNEFYVAPIINRYLQKLGSEGEDSRVLNILSQCKLEFTYHISDSASYFSNLVSDELHLIEHLGIAEIWHEDFPKSVPIELLSQLQKDNLAVKDAKKWTVSIYKITDIEILKEFGVYDVILKFLRNVESIDSRFSAGDYSQIARSF